MEFRILGPVEVRDDGRVVRLGGGKQRAVLALLLLNANRVVASERMIELLWGEQPPATAATALHGHISSLRKTLGPDVIATRPPGYALELGIGDLDLERFERLRAEGRDALERGDPGGAAERLRAALELWRGEALSDIGFEPFIQAEAARLEGLRLDAVQDRIEADLTTGRGTELVGELERLVAAEPLRERLWAQLMLALYRSGRQAEALDAYRRARQTLVSQLAIEPGPELRDLERRILAQDPTLGRGPRVPTPLRRSANARLALVLMALAAIGVVVTALLLFGGDSGRTAVPADSVADHRSSTQCRRRGDPCLTGPRADRGRRGIGVGDQPGQPVGVAHRPAGQEAPRHQGSRRGSRQRRGSPRRGMGPGPMLRWRAGEPAAHLHRRRRWHRSGRNDLARESHPQTREPEPAHCRRRHAAVSPQPASPHGSRPTFRPGSSASTTIEPRQSRRSSRRYRSPTRLPPSPSAPVRSGR